MQMYEIISLKRDNKKLSKEMIKYFVQGVTKGVIPDYQISALLMAICINGMDTEETANLTMAMASSGEMADLSEIEGEVVDKHSSGGVGDKCTLIIGPIVSACGSPFAKLSGRGLGHTGGTIDKLESIKGMRTSISNEDFISQVNRIGLAVSGQTPELAPADKKLYALRDVTATVESIPLITSSIMSKKIAAGAPNILLDVKCGNGAFMKNEEDAIKLAASMTGIGKKIGRKVWAYVTDMDSPLGKKVGNSLEVDEAYEVLSGEGPEDLKEICFELSSAMLQMTGVGSENECMEKVRRSISDGSALNKFREFILAQGGVLDPDGYPVYTKKPLHSIGITAENSGYIFRMNTEDIGRASLVSGAGREKADDEIDPAAGIVLEKKTSEKVNIGDRLAVIYGDDMIKLEQAAELLKSAYVIKDEKPNNRNVIIKKIRQQV